MLETGFEPPAIVRTIGKEGRKLHPRETFEFGLRETATIDILTGEEEKKRKVEYWKTEAM
jgi:hypothetical protein